MWRNTTSRPPTDKDDGNRESISEGPPQPASARRRPCFLDAFALIKACALSATPRRRAPSRFGAACPLRVRMDRAPGGVTASRAPPPLPTDPTGRPPRGNPGLRPRLVRSARHRDKLLDVSSAARGWRASAADFVPRAACSERSQLRLTASSLLCRLAARAAWPSGCA